MDKKRKTKKKLNLSRPKKKSCPSSSHFICDKEVVVRLERLSDSVVAEMTAGGSALPPEQVNESNDDTLDINSLPNEIILKVFGFLEQNQLGQIARVCKRWNVLTKSPVLWKKVNVKFSPSHECQSTVAEYFINTLPSCTISIRLDFVGRKDWFQYLNFEELCLRLQEKCPHLEELILIHSVLQTYSLSSIIHFCCQFLQDVKTLIFHYSTFNCDRSTYEYFGISKIKILELLYCYLRHPNKPPFLKMPHLKQLHLRGTNVEDTWFLNDTSFLIQLHVLNVGRTHYMRSWTRTRIFSTIQNHGHNLKELYLCEVDLEDHNLTFTDSAFPHLKTICLVRAWVTCECVVSLIRSCPSLENVYVNEDVAESFAEHPFVVASRCNAGIVKAIGLIHNHHVYYLYN